MTAWYNEIDPYAAQWLRNLIDAGHIAPGVVDERSIVDVKASELADFTQCHFFAGIGGWSLALRRAGWSDDRPVWTGSCPCQPFSAAGKQKGFADERHLWPVFKGHIAERRPAVVFGEQVASATEWLRLVRGDLEALGYAVGAIPVQAASAGADHLRDRFWFVGHDESGRRGDPRSEVSAAGGEGTDRGSGIRSALVNDQGDGRGEGRAEHEVRGGRPTVAGTGGVGMADANEPGSQGRPIHAERADQRSVGPDGMANTNVSGESQGWEQRGGQQRGTGSDTETRTGLLANAERSRGQQSSLEADAGNAGWQGGNGFTSDGFEWVIGADGKARRVKPGIRLLAHGVPDRVAKLRAFGNAIDPRPAAEFIGAYLETLT